MRPGVELSVAELGPEGAPTLLFLHGGAGAMFQWSHQLRYLAPSWRVIALDFRGHGESPECRASRYDADEFLSDVEAATDVLGLPERFGLLGHSFGGAVAAGYAVRHPHRLERLVLMSIAERVPLSPWTPKLLKLPLPVLTTVRRLFRNQLNCSPAVLKKLVPAIMAWSGHELFHRIQVPTLVVAGEWDLLTRVRRVREMAERIPGAGFEVVRTSGHLPQLERPSAVNRLLERFLDPERATSRCWRGTLEVPHEVG